jgi:hypothetical protein
MTGFKEGASPSGFDDDVSEEESGDEVEDLSSEPETSTASAVTEENDSGLPWKYRRENARDGRPKTKQIHLQPSTARQEDTFRGAVQNELEEDVELTDLREAALLVAMEHVDEVADQLREWGYDYE